MKDDPRTGEYSADQLCPRCGVVKPCLAHEGWPTTNYQNIERSYTSSPQESNALDVNRTAEALGRTRLDVER